MDTHIYGNTFLFARTKKSTSAHFNDVISLFASRQNGKAGHAPAAAGLSWRAASAASRGARCVCLSASSPASGVASARSPRTNVWKYTLRPFPP